MCPASLDIITYTTAFGRPETFMQSLTGGEVLRNSLPSVVSPLTHPCRSKLLWDGQPDSPTDRLLGGTIDIRVPGHGQLVAADGNRVTATNEA